MYKEYQIFKSVLLLPPTSADIEGPFYKPDAPLKDILADNPTLHLTGVVQSIHGESLYDATLDFWQSDDKGVYDNTGFNFRGKVKTDLQGNYQLHTTHPGYYQIGENEFRCSHIHVKVWCTNYKLLTTQLYFSDDKYDDVDHWFSAYRVIGPANVQNAKFDFVLRAL